MMEFAALIATILVLSIPLFALWSYHRCKVLELQVRGHGVGGVRAELDDSSDRMAKKIRTQTKNKVPFQLIAGEEDKTNKSVSFRYRDGHQENGIPVTDAIARITDAISTHAQV